jgi:hypothetical protein
LNINQLNGDIKKKTAGTKNFLSRQKNKEWKIMLIKADVKEVFKYTIM